MQRICFKESENISVRIMGKEFFRKYQLIWFVLICYLMIAIVSIIQIVIGIPQFSRESPTISGFFLWFFYIFSPTFAAVIVTTIAEGKDSLRRLLKGYIIWRVNWVWYFAAFLLLLAPLLVGVVYFFIGDTPGIDQSLTVGSVVYLIGYGLVSGPVSEEGGWRGYMLPKLQEKFNALISSLILGVIWFVWHIPLFFIKGSSQYESRSLFFGIIYFILVMSIGLILTWLYNNAKGSLIITILGHFCFNFSSVLIVSILGLMPTMVFNIVGGVLGVCYLLFILLYAGYKRFSRKPDDELPFTPPTKKESEPEGIEAQEVFSSNKNTKN
ncbi:MAG: CPBP family intramembrane metalloprotease [Candidatus Heimdallarchaeota archaeon]|nr:CPBP family intramembrane metalloprotease [Candidatus Heimdallarchaeota archaeon]